MSEERSRQAYALLKEPFLKKDKKSKPSIELADLSKLKKDQKEKPIEVPELFSHMLSFLSSEELANIRGLSTSADQEAKHISDSRRADETKLKELLYGKKEFEKGSHEGKWKSEHYSAFYSNFYSNVRRLFYKSAKQPVKMLFVCLLATFLMGCLVIMGIGDGSGIRIDYSSHFLSLGRFILNEAILTLCAGLFIGIAAFILLKKGDSYNSLIYSLDRFKKYFYPSILFVNAAFATFFYIFSPAPLNVTYFIGLMLVNLFSSSLFCFEMLQGIRDNLSFFWSDKLGVIKKEFFKTCRHIINNKDKNNADKISNDFLVKIALNLRVFLGTDTADNQKKEILFDIEKIIAKRELENLLRGEEKMVIQPDQTKKFIREIMNIYVNNADLSNHNSYITFGREEKQEKKMIDRTDIYILTDEQRKHLIAHIKLDTMIAELDNQIREIMSHSSNNKFDEIRQKWGQLMTHMKTNENILTVNERMTTLFEKLIAHAKTNTNATMVNERGVIIFEMLMDYTHVLTVHEKGMLIFEMMKFYTKMRQNRSYPEINAIDQVNTWIESIKEQRAEVELNEIFDELNKNSSIKAADFLKPEQRKAVIATIKRDYQDTIKVIVNRMEDIDNNAQNLTPEQKKERAAVLIDGTVALTREQKGVVIDMLRRTMAMNQAEVIVDAKEEKGGLPPPVHDYLSPSSPTLFAGTPPSAPVVGATSEVLIF